MAFSKEWEICYRNNRQMSIWPWSDLISYVMRYAKPTSADYKVLELGCGPGANIPFFNKLGILYYSIDGSRTIVQKVWKRFPECKKNIKVGDFTKRIPFEVEFDLVIDRASLTHNNTKDIQKTIALVFEKLKPGGKFIGIDWFSTLHSDFSKGKSSGDNYSREGIKDGLFANLGKVHFADKQHILRLFAKYEMEMLESKLIKTEIPEKKTRAFWDFVAVKTKKNI
jgi:SAM-dependent methyltransferase